VDNLLTAAYLHDVSPHDLDLFTKTTADAAVILKF